jgi:hypothetical protein
MTVATAPLEDSAGRGNNDPHPWSYFLCVLAKIGHVPPPGRSRTRIRKAGLVLPAWNLVAGHVGVAPMSGTDEWH